MTEVVITGTGLYSPDDVITNEELVASFNAYVSHYNELHSVAIEMGDKEPLQPSSADFIVKASGIKRRHVLDKKGILDIARMYPQLPDRTDDSLSIQAEMALLAVRQALEDADRNAQDVDGVIVACSNMQRAYPAMAVELQNALGVQGFAYDMNVACSSATFGIQAAANAIRSGSAKCMLVVSPEICSAHLNFRDRDSHFIFGDACTAVVLENRADAITSRPLMIMGERLVTQFSNNIRNNFGFLNRCVESDTDTADKLFMQQGRKVFKDVCPMVSNLVINHLQHLGISEQQIRRLWLHQANLNMNQLIARRILGREPAIDEAPVILDEYANTSSAGSIICFHLHRQDLVVEDIGVICSFGAGYSAGSIVVKQLA
ncbi:beta-ketoacyl-ACP synthase III [Zooshikella harenae]|uniref:Beta-ketoacyl-ACP synthase III n=1 Tax=Zooshikella harenae TaxID=2827238 RepID=A0ABS5ZGI8_9GAMM|nr:beta-ketoacyl-ACP synthase III [Zooshikella harenae]MBU2712365.1 beta-ketoacyl-ACP synthase III [Zooshikella harenae]